MDGKDTKREDSFKLQGKEDYFRAIRTKEPHLINEKTKPDHSKETLK